MKNFILFLLKLRKFSYRGYGSPNVRIRKFSTVTFLLLTLLPTAAFSTTNYDPGVNGNIGGFQGTNWTTYTVAAAPQGFGTLGAQALRWHRVGNDIYIQGRITTGTTTASQAQLPLPTGLTVAADVVSTSFAGTAHKNAAIGTVINALALAGNSYIQFALASSAELTADTGSNIFSNSTVYDFAIGPVAVTGWSAGGAGGAKLPTIQRFTSGSGTYTTPSGVTYIKVRMVGGGSGGSGSGSGGGCGGNGGAGGNTTFGSSLLTANGGAAVTACDIHPTAGGTATVSAPATGMALQGAYGQGIQGNLSTVPVTGGMGGSTPFGGAGAGSGGISSGPVAGSSAIANTGSGGGGAGAAGSSYSGGGGAAGGYIEAVIITPSSTYSYAVGAAGTAGTAGGSGAAGGAGGSGVIIVEEFY